ncbi:hypothetical protein QJS66_15685 [Kocuria rhizophila]|nr:hypothetical protein QJS66_15685 [Kocuria rhizophila]
MDIGPDAGERGGRGALQRRRGLADVPELCDVPLPLPGARHRARRPEPRTPQGGRPSANPTRNNLRGLDVSRRMPHCRHGHLRLGQVQPGQPGPAGPRARAPGPAHGGSPEITGDPESDLLRPTDAAEGRPRKVTLGAGACAASS